MKTSRSSSLIAVIVLVAAAGSAWAGFINPIGEQISYQGRLDQGGQAFNGTVPMVFRVWPEESGGASTPFEIELNVDVANGLFQVELDFGNTFGSEAKWLEVEVNGQVLSPRQPIRAVPLALHALSTDIPPFPGWRLDGNAGTNPATDFIGTLDDQAFTIRTRNAQSLRIEPSAVLSQGLPITSNVIAGAQGNFAWPSARGATIGGGGTSGLDPDHPGTSSNRVTDDYGTVGGGSGNQAGNAAGTSSDRPFATVAGGIGNLATGIASNVGGGQENGAIGEHSTVAGGYINVAMASLSVVSGGQINRARSESSAVAGGSFNVAAGRYAFVSGGRNSCAGGDYSWAGGRQAKVRPGTNPPEGGACFGLTYPGGEGDRGTFVWADSTEGNFVSTGSNQFLVRAAGGMGINTNQPEADLHVAGDGDVLLEGGSPRVSFFRPGVDPFVSQNHIALAANGTLVTRLAGSTRLTVTNTGNMGLGVTAPTFQLHLSQNSAAKPTSNTWTVSSDERLKTDIETLDDALNRLLALRGVSFRWRDPAAMGGHDERYAGLLAQNVEQVFPEWVGLDPQGYKTVTVTGFEGLVAEALRELRAEKDAEMAAMRSEQADHLAALQAEVAMLKLQSDQLRELADRNAELERRLDAMAARQRDQHDLRERLSALEALLLSQGAALTDASL